MAGNEVEVDLGKERPGFTIVVVVFRRTWLLRLRVGVFNLGMRCLEWVTGFRVVNVSLVPEE